MSGKQEKKLRQLYRRNIRKNELAAQVMVYRYLKPKPRFVPVRVWVWLLSFFVNLTD